MLYHRSPMIVSYVVLVAFKSSNARRAGATSSCYHSHGVAVSTISTETRCAQKMRLEARSRCPRPADPSMNHSPAVDPTKPSA